MSDLIKCDWDKIGSMTFEKTKVSNILKGLIAMIEELENENALLRCAAGRSERCGTCVHFSRYTEDSGIDYNGKHAGRCDSGKFIYDEDTKLPADGLRYWDYEGYSAGFEVGEQFGCIHWARPNVV